jgi:translation initiation factor 3 subunit E
MSELSNEELAIAREYDLTKKVLPFLDRHLSYPILDSLRELYGDEAIDLSIFELFEGTNMISFLQNQWKAIHGDDKPLPAELTSEKEEEISAVFHKLNKSTSEILSVLNQVEVQEQLKQDKVLNRAYLSREHGVSDEQINELYEFGQFQYNRGDYVVASDLLSNFRALSTDTDMVNNATWGKLAGDIIRLQWESAIKELKNLRDVVDSRSNFQNPLVQLHHRIWIIHWSLFPFFNSEDGLEQLLDLFLSSSYLSTIQAAAPWILRYLVAAVVCSETSSNKNNLSSSPNFQKRLKDLIKVVKQEEYEYRDPLTDFIKALYVDYDFSEANSKLIEASSILKTDFFLTNLTETFLTNARHLISEVYCKVHQRINLNDISKSLNLTREEGEKLIANLIKETKMDAKIDESEGTVILNHPTTSVYQQVIEKTKGLSFKANQILATALEKDIN